MKTRILVVVSMLLFSACNFAEPVPEWTKKFAGLDTGMYERCGSAGCAVVRVVYKDAEWTGNEEEGVFLQLNFRYTLLSYRMRQGDFDTSILVPESIKGVFINAEDQRGSQIYQLCRELGDSYEERMKNVFQEPPLRQPVDASLQIPKNEADTITGFAKPNGSGFRFLVRVSMGHALVHQLPF